MRVAIVSDIHGNRTAFEAVLADVRETAPDLILHGGDLADGGAHPAEIVDRIRDLGWQGVSGNADEMLWRPASLDEFAEDSSAPRSLFSAIANIAAATREALGDERIAWLRNLPRVQFQGPIGLVHAKLNTTWRAPQPEAPDDELESTYSPVGRPIVVYAHIHRPFIRNVRRRIVANAGSVSLSCDGDPRAAYLLLDDDQPSIRRVPYELNKEVKALSESGMPHADWIAAMLAGARPQMP